MPFTNFDARHFSGPEKNIINDAITHLETALVGKLANLTPEERKQYGSVNEQNKLIINKVKDYHDTQPAMSSPDVDWVEFDADHDSRAFIQNLIQRLMSVLDGLNNAKVLHDWDNYQASLSDYEFAKYKNGTNATGYETKVNELKQFFNRTGESNPPVEKPIPPVE